MLLFNPFLPNFVFQSHHWGVVDFHKLTLVILFLLPLTSSLSFIMTWLLQCVFISGFTCEYSYPCTFSPVPCLDQISKCFPWPFLIHILKQTRGERCYVASQDICLEYLSFCWFYLWNLMDSNSIIFGFICKLKLTIIYGDSVFF